MHVIAVKYLETVQTYNTVGTRITS